MVNSRRKGKDGELEAVKLLHPWFPDCKRSIGQARNGAEKADLINTGPFYVEVKRRKHITDKMLCDWWNELIIEWAHSTPIPLLLYRCDRTDWRCWVLKLGDTNITALSWTELVEILNNSKGETK